MHYHDQETLETTKLIVAILPDCLAITATIMVTKESWMILAQIGCIVATRQ